MFRGSGAPRTSPMPGSACWRRNSAKAPAAHGFDDERRPLFRLETVTAAAAGGSAGGNGAAAAKTARLPPGRHPPAEPWSVTSTRWNSGHDTLPSSACVAGSAA